MKKSKYKKAKWIKGAYGYFPVTPIRSIDLCTSCTNDVIKFIAKAPKEDNK